MIFRARILISSRAWAIFPPGVLIVINYFSSKKNLFGAMEGERDSSLGTVFYSLSLFLLALFFCDIGNFPFMAAGIMVMAWGDGLAAIVGKKWGKTKIFGQKQKKTLLGSFVMLVTSFAVISLVLNFYFSLSWVDLIFFSFITAGSATLLEALFRSGGDNIAVPLGTAFLLFFLVGG